ncbi:hypothetical protein JG688_00010896, partial [Phytophthora aleatoria]
DCSSRRFLLLAISPLDEEEDLGAQSLFDQIADTLSHYEKPWVSVLFMVGGQLFGKSVHWSPRRGAAYDWLRKPQFQFSDERFSSYR